MSDDPDYLFALKLQQQLDAENEEPHAENAPQSDADKDYQLALMLQNEMNDDSLDDSIEALDMSHNNNNKSSGKDPGGRNGVTNSDTYLDQTQNLVHPEWELVDPNPDIYAMFTRFDEKFFQRRLGAVTVEWSKRMYSCAGICYQRGNRFIKTVIIRLSEPLLKLRPRKDLVETLLHEMIHAYCFVQNIIEGNGGHGPNFKRIMETINKVAGTNITVYHSFHDEVNLYKTHIWRCNGICQHHHPFQGWVKRTSNRAPGPGDQWWSKHQRECSGTFVKMSEPQKPEKPSKADTKPKPKIKAPTTAPSAAKDIRNYFKKPQLPKELVPNSLPTGNVVTNFPPTSYPGTSNNPLEGLQSNMNKKKKPNEHNRIVGLKDLTGDDSDSDKDQPTPKGDEMQGQGYSLTNGKGSSSLNDISDATIRKNVRDIWAKRFGNNNDSKEKPKDQENPKKRRRDSTEDTPMIAWETFDDDIMFAKVDVPLITISDSESDGETPQRRQSTATRTPAASQPSSQELTILIKREIMEDESIYDDDDIIMIDDEYNDNADDLTAASELADQSIIDDLFGEDTLLQEFQRENDVYPRGSNYLNDAANDITSCPICFDKMKRSEFANHLEGCSITIRVPPPSMKGKSNQLSTANKINNMNKKAKTTNRVGSKSKKKEILKTSGYTDADIEALNLSSSSDSSASTSFELTPRQQRQRSLHQMTTQCPKCGQSLLGHQMESHRNICKRGRR